MKSFKKAFRKGFSLIELSVVLIIIGLLMAAIIKGRDLIRSAEMKKFYNTVVRGWELAYTTYYDKTGAVLGSPLVTKDYNFTEYVGANYTHDKTDLVLRNPEDIINQADNMGIDHPPRYIYHVGFGVKESDIYLTFGSDPLSKGQQLNISVSGTYKVKTGNENGKGNYMIMFNVPYDVATQIDRIVDGSADGSKGTVICAGAYETPLTNFKNINGTWLNITDLDSYGNCSGTFTWGDKNKPFVTLIYKLGI